MPNTIKSSWFSTIWHSSWLIKLSIILHALIVIALLIAIIFSQGLLDFWPWLFAVFIVNHLVIATVGLWPRSNLLGPNWTKLPPTAIKRNEIALTIDDGPDAVVTPQVLQILDEYAVKATFFCIGHKVLQQPELSREIVRRGHKIENHSQQHRHNFSLLGIKGFSREVAAAQQTLLNITGKQAQFFRAPAGLRNPFLQPVLSKLGLTLASWSVRGFDTRNNDAEKVTNKLLTSLRAGAIILLHDGNAARTKDNVPVILAVLPALLQAAKEQNLHFVTLQDAAL